MCPIDAINTGWIASAPMDKLELQTDYNLQSTVTYNQTTEAGRIMDKLEPIWDFDGVKNCDLRGYMRYARCELESCFGMPHNELEDSPQADDTKVQYEWWFDIDGTPVTIYDYKEFGKIDPDEEILWHIGGQDFGAVLKVQWLGFEKAVTRPEYVEGLENIWGFTLKEVSSACKETE